MLFDNAYVQYYSGFSFIPTERPMAFLINSKGQRGLFVPRLEQEHAQANSLIDRVDSYIVSVTDGGRFIGDRRLVRIESVGRSAATASLVGGSDADPATDRTAPAGEAGDAGGGDSAQVRSPSSRRRRGRRGGRRRSGARASNGSKSNGDVSGTTS